jgi:hypothetical protein
MSTVRDWRRRCEEETRGQIGIPVRFWTEKLRKLLASSFSLDTGTWLRGRKKPCRNSPILLGFSGLEPISWARSPKEVTLTTPAVLVVSISSSTRGPLYVLKIKDFQKHQAELNLQNIIVKISPDPNLKDKHNQDHNFKAAYLTCLFYFKSLLYKIPDTFITQKM